MKGIKPFKLGFLTRPFSWGSTHRFGVSVLAYFPFDPAGALLPDMDLWSSLGDLMGDAPPLLDVGLPKSRAEFIVVGKAFTRDGMPATTCPVRVRVGGLEKRLSVIGDRRWVRGVPTQPRPFTQMPLTFNRAFGGEGYEQNPEGIGYAPVEDEAGQSVHALPNVEHPGRLIRSPKDRPEPASFGPIDLLLPQRQGLAGTYDAEWLETRYPGFAKDMDWRMWNMAAADQQQERPFSYDAPLHFENLHPTKPELTASLPNVLARCFVTRRDVQGRDHFEEVPLELKTVWLFPNAERGVVIFSGAAEVREDDATDIEHLLVCGERPGAPRPPEHYYAVLQKRLEPANAAEVLNDSDLVAEDMTGFGAALDHALEITTPKNLRLERQRTRAEAGIAESRAHVASLGLDPDEHAAQPLPPKQEPASLKDLPDRVREQLEQMEAIKAEADADRAAHDAQTRKFFDSVGLDYDMIEEEKTVPTRGPPEKKADGWVVKLRKLADDVAATGEPSDELEAYASDPEMYARLKMFEDKSLEGYRIAAHFQEPAFAIAEDDAAIQRALVEDRVQRREGFAGVDLTGADLSGMDLSGADFSLALMESVRLVECNLSGCNFESTVLAHADLTSARVHKTSFRGANLGKARLVAVDSGGEVDFTDAQLYGANLSGASLVGADLRRAQLMEAVLENADLSRAVLDQLFFVRSVLRGARMTGVSARLAAFVEIEASGMDLSGSTLDEAVFLKCNLDDARFGGASMNNFRFVMSTARRADFRGVTMCKANLRGSALEGAEFSGARLDKTDLSEAQLMGARFYRAIAHESAWMKADLRETNFVSADLLGALMSKADIRGADLRHSNLYGADFALVRSDAQTKVEGAIQLKVRTKPVRKEAPRDPASRDPRGGAR